MKSHERTISRRVIHNTEGHNNISQVVPSNKQLGGFFMSNSKTRKLVEGAAMVALATVLSYIRVFKLPWGGSVTLLSMLPIVVYSLRWGIKDGFMVSFVFSLVQFFQGIGDGLFGWGLSPAMLVACIVIDYLGAFTVLGIAGFMRDKKSSATANGIIGVTVAIVLRFICHFLSGVVIWHSFGELWEGFATENEWLYSLLYNGAYMLPELIFTLVATIILFNITGTRKLLLDTDKIA